MFFLFLCIGPSFLPSPVHLPGSWISGDAILILPSEKLTALYCLPTNELPCMEDDKAKSNHSYVPKHVPGSFASIFVRLQKMFTPGIKSESSPSSSRCFPPPRVDGMFLPKSCSCLNTIISTISTDNIFFPSMSVL